MAGEDIDISFLNDNYMSLVDNEPVVQDQISYLKVGEGKNVTISTVFCFCLINIFVKFSSMPYSRSMMDPVTDTELQIFLQKPSLCLYVLWSSFFIYCSLFHNLLLE